MDGKVNLDLSGVHELMGRISKSKKVRVGILGEGDKRDDDSGLGNAGIGLVQEMGSVTRNIPPRSFIRMPLEQKKGDLINAT